MLSINDLTNVIKIIVEQQKTIIGPLAIAQANKVSGIKITDAGNLTIQVTDPDGNKLLNNLINKYRELFGQSSVEVCKDAIREHQTSVPIKELPSILQS